MSASVPELTAIACLYPNFSAKSRSNFLTFSPSEAQLRAIAFSRCSRAIGPIFGLPNGILIVTRASTVERGRRPARSGHPSNAVGMPGREVVRGFVEDDARPRVLELEGDAEQVEALGDARVILGPSEDEQEAAAPRAEELAANGSRVERRRIGVVDERVAHLGAQVALELPEIVEELAEGDDVLPALQDRERLVDHLLDALELLRLVGESVDDGFRDRRCGPGLARVEEKQMLVQLAEPLLRERDGLDGDLARGREVEAVEAAEGRHVLVLAAHVVLDLLLLEVDGIRRELA